MFNGGLGEILVILVVAILVFGPKHISEITRMLAKIFVWLNHHAENARQVFETEVKRYELEKNIKRAESVDYSDKHD